MGGMKDNCFPRECGGDKYFGQWDCGLKHLKYIFAVSTAYFDYSEYNEVGHIKLKKGRVMGKVSDCFK